MEVNPRNSAGTLVLGPQLCTRLDLSARYDWPFKKRIVNLPINLKGNSKRISGNFLGDQNKDIGAASQTLLTGVRLRL